MGGHSFTQIYPHNTALKVNNIPRLAKTWSFILNMIFTLMSAHVLLKMFESIFKVRKIWIFSGIWAALLRCSCSLICRSNKSEFPPYLRDLGWFHFISYRSFFWLLAFRGKVGDTHPLDGDRRCNSNPFSLTWPSGSSCCVCRWTAAELWDRNWWLMTTGRLLLVLWLSKVTSYSTEQNNLELILMMLREQVSISFLRTSMPQHITVIKVMFMFILRCFS